MRPIHRNPCAVWAAEQFVDRDAERLALDVEQSIADGSDSALVDGVGACTYLA
jgi:hypothetical protein